MGCRRGSSFFDWGHHFTPNNGREPSRRGRYCCNCRGRENWRRCWRGRSRRGLRQHHVRLRCRRRSIIQSVRCCHSSHGNQCSSKRSRFHCCGVCCCSISSSYRRSGFRRDAWCHCWWYCYRQCCHGGCGGQHSCGSDWNWCRAIAPVFTGASRESDLSKRAQSRVSGWKCYS